MTLGSRMGSAAVGAGLFLAAVIVFRYWSDRPTLVSLLAFVFLVLGAGMVIAMLRNPEHYCMDCGQFVGRMWDGLPATCVRCGCNRYTETAIEAGRKIRNR